MNGFFRKFFKWAGIVLGVTTGLFAIALAVLYYISDRQMNRSYIITPGAVAIPTGAGSIVRGEHLVNDILFCRECHGENLGGQVFDDGWIFGKLAVPNLTSGQGGITAEFSDEDWIRAIRHGVGTDHRSLVGMWSNYYNVLSDQDLGAVIAYIKTIPPVDNILPPTRMGPMARLLILQDETMLPAQVIDHTRPPVAAAPKETGIAYGQYLATFCTMCHGENLAGETLAGTGGNLTPGGKIGEWTFQQFVQTLRTGVTPEGKELDPLLMPWKQLSNLSDEELNSIWQYLQTIPAVETGEIEAVSQ